MSDSRSFFEKLTGSVRVEETPAEPIEEVAEEPEQEFEVRAAASSTAARPKKHAVRTIPVETESSKKSAWPEPEEAEGQLTVDIFDTGDYIVIQSTVAGVDPENLDISYTDDMVTIRGKRERMA
jgi:HSP20 family molecular chaperone IbpA